MQCFFNVNIVVVVVVVIIVVLQRCCEDLYLEFDAKISRA